MAWIRSTTTAHPYRVVGQVGQWGKDPQALHRPTLLHSTFRGWGRSRGIVTKAEPETQTTPPEKSSPPADDLHHFMGCPVHRRYDLISGPSVLAYHGHTSV